MDFSNNTLIPSRDSTLPTTCPFCRKSVPPSHNSRRCLESIKLQHPHFENGIPDLVGLQRS